MKESFEKAKKAMGPKYGLSALAALLMAFVLSQFIFTTSESIIDAIIPAFWVWLGFIMPVPLTDVLFGGKSWKLFAINTGYQLVSILVMGAILGMWR